MSAVRFQTTIGEDRVIHLPADVQVTPGEAEVVILQPKQQQDGLGAGASALVRKLAGLARELGVDTSDLPTDLAQNHDHYLHGLPKGIDEQ